MLPNKDEQSDYGEGQCVDQASTAVSRQLLSYTLDWFSWQKRGDGVSIEVECHRSDGCSVKSLRVMITNDL